MALGRNRESIISIYGFSWSDIICNRMWGSYSRISYVHLPKQRGFNASSLYFSFIFLFALPHFCDVPRYLSHRFPKHFYYVVLRDILWRVFQKKNVVFAAGTYGLVG